MVVAHRILSRHRSTNFNRSSESRDFDEEEAPSGLLNRLSLFRSRSSFNFDEPDLTEVQTEHPSIPHSTFYKRVDGHDYEYLKYIDSTVGSKKNCIYLAGGSSLDNKFWITETAEAVNGFEAVLNPPVMKQDVAYWMNMECSQRGHSLYCLNAAVEGSTLNDRSWGALLKQDHLIKETLCRNDYLIVSIGDNDITLSPQLCTIANLLLLSCCTPASCTEKYSRACVPNFYRCFPSLDCGCVGGGVQGCLCGFPLGCPPGIGYFVDLFKNRVENFVRRILPNAKSRYPKKVIITMLYFMDETPNGGLNDCSPKCLGYDAEPVRLQTVIRSIYKLATQKININGTEVVALPLFDVLDGKTCDDYVERMAPSVSGGQKIATALMDALDLGLEKPALGLEICFESEKETL